MMRYVTFGQSHRHTINGVTFDKDCIAIVHGDREKVFEIFGRQWCFEFTPEEFDKDSIKHFPRGFIHVDQ